MRGVRPQQHLAQRIPQVRPFGNRDRQHRQRVRNAILGRLRQRVSVRGHQREDAQDGRGVVELRAGLDVDAPLVEQEIGSRDRRAPPPELAIETHRRRQMFHQQRRAAIHHPRMTVISAHPVGGIGRAPRLQADRSRRGLVLRLPVQRVVVAPVPEMQKTSRRSQKIEGRFRVAARALEHSAALPRPLLGFLQMEQHREPHREMIIAQSAGAIFQVGFQMKDGIAKLGVPRARNLAQLLRNRRPFAQHQPRKGHLVKLLVQRKLPGQETPVERGQREFQVVGIEPSGLFHGARAGAGPQADVPHALDDGPHRFSRVLLGLLVGKGEQHVDVRVGEQILAPVAAQSPAGPRSAPANRQTPGATSQSGCGPPPRSADGWPPCRLRCDRRSGAPAPSPAYTAPEDRPLPKRLHS